MTTRLTRTVLSCLALLMTMPTLVSAKPGHRGDGVPRMDLVRLERMAESLALDEDTLEEIKKTLYAAQEVGIRLRAEMESAQLKVRRSMDEDAPNRGEVMKNLEGLSQAELALRKHRTGVLLDVQAKLSPGQRKELRQQLRKSRHKKKGRHHRRGQTRGGPAD